MAAKPAQAMTEPTLAIVLRKANSGLHMSLGSHKLASVAHTAGQLHLLVSRLSVPVAQTASQTRHERKENDKIHQKKHSLRQCQAYDIHMHMPCYIV